MLLTTSLHDPRGGFWEPLKYCAKMRETAKVFKKDKHIMIKADLTSGHGGSSERYTFMKDEAFKYAFIIKYT